MPRAKMAYEHKVRLRALAASKLTRALEATHPRGYVASRVEAEFHHITYNGDDI